MMPTGEPHTAGRCFRPKKSWKGSLAALFFAFQGCANIASAQSEIIVPRGGEHATFTRLAMQLPAQTSWSLRQVGQQATLSFTPAPDSFDLSQTFRRIDRARLSRISAAAGQLSLELACDCILTAIKDPSGLLVVDIQSPGVTPNMSPTPHRPARRPEQAQSAQSVGQIVAQQRSTGVQSDPHMAKTLWQQRLLANSTSAETAEASDSTTDAPLAPTNEITGTLARQLARAAGQGIVALRTEPPNEVAQAQSPEDSPDVPRPLPNAVADHLRLGNKATEDMTAQVTEARGAHDCSAENQFNLVNWATNAPFGVQVANHRQTIATNDDPAHVLDFAKFYLHFGFGSEAAVLLADPQFNNGAVELLRDLAQILDGKLPAPDSAIGQMSGCGDVAALWAMLAAHDGIGASPDINAIVRSFGALPDHLRRDLGPRVAQRLLASGEYDAAQFVQTASERSVQVQTDAHSILAARIALEATTPAGPATHVLLGDLPQSRDAVLLHLEHALTHNDGLTPDLIEIGLAHAADLKDTAEGGRLYALSVEGLARTGAFDDAFATLDRLTTSGVGFLPRHLNDTVWDILATSAADAAFVSTTFERQPWQDPQRLRPATRALIADRLTDLGFFAHASAVMPPATIAPPDAATADAAPDPADALFTTLPSPPPMSMDPPDASSEPTISTADTPQALGNTLLSSSAALRADLMRLLTKE